MNNLLSGEISWMMMDSSHSQQLTQDQSASPEYNQFQVGMQPPVHIPQQQIEIEIQPTAQQPILAVEDHCIDSSPQINKYNGNEKKIKELETKCIDIDKRLQELQSRATGVNSMALQQLGRKYIDTLAEQDSIQDTIYRLDSRGSNPLAITGMQKFKRRYIFRLCMFFLMAFSGIMLSSCWVKMC
ncbi:hypothetical protein JCGZ_07217 [Jatropha curcas]|uniref:Uncharacterized protein n=1 Tax=Jatropha curcas TaxID=180498 RepID=A0A067KBP5_JATCU|nr:hypothetical protein JCGZ_07217 [Jatropha curcas]